MTSAAPLDLGALDRLVSRSVAVIGLVGLAIVWFASWQHIPRSAIVAFAGAYAVGKAAIGVMGALRGWPAWPAALAEGLAIIVVAAIVWTGTKETVYLVVTAVLLVGAGFWRSRVARMTSGDA
jgi:hypothetical protein